MSVYRAIRDALAPLGIAVTDFYGDARADFYAVVTEVMETPELRTDDAETLTGHYVQVDFISKNNQDAAVRRAVDLLAAAGFVRRNTYREYEPVSRTFRTLLRLRLITEYGEG